MTERREITLDLAGKEFTFNLTPQDVTKYFNAVTQNNKVAPSNNLLTTTVQQDQLATLRPLLANPMLTMKVAGALLEEYAPDVEVTVKKPSPALKD
ncbi:putative phage tail assembly chaperone [Pseudomonas aeruginosa]|nr:putative phage tail assembly chaperone [Pseudomonas aeruginosa]MBW6123265.1 putative phage tail assembly chaperone [Pseudomonas aeruginosa]MCU9048004.1 putative phage tail assembly chaperone [Pseudomonas aeruginosa]MCU9088405.1 putative phage tail assembly chaperone [Pseudomonas aeruginosa]